MTKEGRDLSELQSQFRDQVLNAEPGDVVGGADGSTHFAPVARLGRLP